MTVGDNIKKIRIEKGLTQKELGELCGMADSAIRRYENGPLVPKLSTLNKIAQALNVSISLLIDVTSSINIEQETPRALVASMKLCSSPQQLNTITEIIKDLDKLNYKGQDMAKKQINMLTKIPEYQKNEEKEYVSVIDVSTDTQ